MRKFMSSHVPEQNVPLVIDHIDYAKRLARQFFYERQNIGVDLEDFEGAALLGLCDAACRFDETRGMAFQTFCFFRVKGAMYDLLRRGGGVSRRQFAALTRTSDGAAESEDESTEQPQSKSSSALPYAFARSTSALGSLASIIEEVGIRLHYNKESQVTDISYAVESDPETQTAIANTRRYLSRILAELPERQRQLLELRYFEGQSFEEIRSSLDGVSKSWISRLHAKALNSVKAKMLEDRAALQSGSEMSEEVLYDHLA